MTSAGVGPLGRFGMGSVYRTYKLRVPGLLNVCGATFSYHLLPLHLWPIPSHIIYICRYPYPNTLGIWVLFTMLYISKLGFYSLVVLIALVIILFACCIFHNWGSYPLVGLMPFSYYFNSKLVTVLVIYFSTLLHSQTWS